MLFYIILVVSLFWTGLCVTEVARGLKSYLWKFFICLYPCLLFGWITGDAITAYVSGEPNHHFRLKLGVDLEGGTILVYEIDLKKLQAEKSERGEKREGMANLLAEALKRHIDPNDLYNIVIRPVGDERVEIILPTGGHYRTQKAENVWNKLLESLEVSQKLEPKSLNVGRGKVDELADRIQELKSKTVWESNFKESVPLASASFIGLLGSPQVQSPLGAASALFHSGREPWDKLLERVYAIDGEYNDLATVIRPGKKDYTKEQVEAITSLKPSLAKLEPGKTEPLILLIQKQRLAQVGENISEADLKKWLKREVWRILLQKVYDHEGWRDFLKDKQADLFRIPADNHEQLIWFVLCKGNVVSQATISTVAPIVGTKALDGPPPNDRETIEKFVEANYGPSLTEIRKNIKKASESTVGQTLDLSVEEVQRIKELVSRVGSLEFRMLANNFDDKEGQKAAKDYIEANKLDLVDLQKEGLPPPGPKASDGKKKPFEINLPHNNKSLLTYSWVELGPQERKQLNLDNAASSERERNELWREAKKYRDLGQASELKGATGTPLLQGALFYSRECLNRSLPEEERRAKKIEYFVLVRDPEFDVEPQYNEKPISGKYLEQAAVSTTELTPTCHFRFDRFGAELFGRLTGKNTPTETGGSEQAKVRRHLAIILDGLIMSAPFIQSKITESGQISGNFTQKEVKALVDILNSGALPATLKPQPVSESTMGPTLGLDTITWGVTAIIVSFGLVLLFMMVYYRFSGLVASAALLCNLLLTIGFMIGVQATFTLPGLAGLVLMVGMAVDANVLIYERLREERDRGASLALAIRNGYDRALPTIIDTHMTGIFTAVVLYVVGNDQLRGYGVSLTVGLIISLFTSLYMTHIIFSFWLSRNWLHKLGMFRFLSKPNIDFMRIRYVMFVATITLAVLGVGLFIARIGEDLNIDFVGGTLYGGKLTDPISMEELRERLEPKNQEKLLKDVEVEEIDITGLDAQGKEIKVDEGTRFNLNYPGEKARKITLANKVEGSTREARKNALKERAKKLPDPAVEQIYPSSDPQPKGMSRYFNIRTLEKEPELVQAILDRLLRKNNKPLMTRTIMKVDNFDENRIATHFRFFKEDGKEEPASPSYVRTLLTRHLAPVFGGKEKIPEYDLIGEGVPVDLKYKVMAFSFKPEVDKKYNLTAKRKDIEKAVMGPEGTQKEFADRPQPERLEVFDSQLASETRYRALWAIIASWGAILLYLWFRFGRLDVWPGGRPLPDPRSVFHPGGHRFLPLPGQSLGQHAGAARFQDRLACRGRAFDPGRLLGE